LEGKLFFVQTIFIIYCKKKFKNYFCPTKQYQNENTTKEEDHHNFSALFSWSLFSLPTSLKITTTRLVRLVCFRELDLGLSGHC